MEFDADWIWIVVFAGVMILRALGSALGRSKKRPTAKVPSQTIVPAEAPPLSSAEMGGSAEVYRVEERPKPIEPR